MKATIELTPQEAAELIAAGYEATKGTKPLSVTVEAGQECRGYGVGERMEPVPQISIQVEV